MSALQTWMPVILDSERPSGSVRKAAQSPRLPKRPGRLRLLKKPVQELAIHLAQHKSGIRTRRATIAAILTYNAYTRYWSQAVIEVCKNADGNELLIFKDPTKEPYLCDYPTRQKGFKKPPS